MKSSSKPLAPLTLARFARALVAADLSPGLAIKARAGEVLSMMRRGANKQALRRLAERKLAPRFDFKRMAREAAGDAWLDANPQQRRSLENGFRKLLLDSYAASLNSADSGGSHLEVKPVRHSNADDVSVKTLIHGAARPAVAIDFRMENQRNGWKVYDVLVDGVSVTTRYREALVAQVRRFGIDGSIKVRDASRLAIMRDLHRRAFA